uniref:Transmembrane protein n=1 Tax=Larkfield virus TaxID=2170548 RepID=A0A2U3TMP2_9VIRU|nr:hypothetical protein [Larkfield virus]
MNNGNRSNALFNPRSEYDSDSSTEEYSFQEPRIHQKHGSLGVLPTSYSGFDDRRFIGIPARRRYRIPSWDSNQKVYYIFLPFFVLLVYLFGRCTFGRSQHTYIRANTPDPEVGIRSARTDAGRARQPERRREERVPQRGDGPDSSQRIFDSSCPRQENAQDEHTPSARDSHDERDVLRGGESGAFFVQCPAGVSPLVWSKYQPRAMPRTRCPRHNA